MKHPNSLFLTIKRRYFDQIASGEKRFEYRRITAWSRGRVESEREYTEILFRAGYSLTAPEMRVEYLGWTITDHNGKRCYALAIGRILDLKTGGPHERPAASRLAGNTKQRATIGSIPVERISNDALERAAGSLR